MPKKLTSSQKARIRRLPSPVSGTTIRGMGGSGPPGGLNAGIPTPGINTQITPGNDVDSVFNLDRPQQGAPSSTDFRTSKLLDHRQAFEEAVPQIGTPGLSSGVERGSLPPPPPPITQTAGAAAGSTAFRRPELGVASEDPDKESPGQPIGTKNGQDVFQDADGSRYTLGNRGEKVFLGGNTLLDGEPANQPPQDTGGGGVVFDRPDLGGLTPEQFNAQAREAATRRASLDALAPVGAVTPTADPVTPGIGSGASDAARAAAGVGRGDADVRQTSRDLLLQLINESEGLGADAAESLALPEFQRSPLETALESRFLGNLNRAPGEDDPITAARRADFEAATGQAREQQIEDLQRFGVLGDGVAAGATADVLGEFDAGTERNRLLLPAQQQQREALELSQILGFNEGQAGRAQNARQFEGNFNLARLGAQQDIANQSLNRRLPLTAPTGQEQFNEAIRQSDEDRALQQGQLTGKFGGEDTLAGLLRRDQINQFTQGRNLDIAQLLGELGPGVLGENAAPRQTLAGRALDEDISQGQQGLDQRLAEILGITQGGQETLAGRAFGEEQEQTDFSNQRDLLNILISASQKDSGLKGLVNDEEFMSRFAALFDQGGEPPPPVDPLDQLGGPLTPRNRGGDPVTLTPEGSAVGENDGGRIPESVVSAASVFTNSQGILKPRLTRRGINDYVIHTETGQEVGRWNGTAWEKA